MTANLVRGLSIRPLPSNTLFVWGLSFLCPIFSASLIYSFIRAQAAFLARLRGGKTTLLFANIGFLPSGDVLSRKGL